MEYTGDLTRSENKHMINKGFGSCNAPPGFHKLHLLGKSNGFTLPN